VADRIKAVEDVPPRCASAQSLYRQPSAMSRQGSGSLAGRALAQPPPTEIPLEIDEAEGEDELPYLERGQRWLERQEAHSLRRALEDMDVKEERKIFDDAQDEAAELVWKHRNPGAAFKNPDAPYKNPDIAVASNVVESGPATAIGYREHLRKGSTHERKTSWAQAAQDIQARQMKRRSRDSSASRSVSGGSKSSSAPSSRVPSDGSLKVPESSITPLEEELPLDSGREPRQRAVQFAEPGPAEAAPVEQTKVGGLRKLIRSRTPSPSKALMPDFKASSKEETQAGAEQESGHARVSSISVAARMASNAMPAHFRNPFSRARESKGKLSRVSTEPLPTTKRFDRFEIQRNPPSQSRDPSYTTNTASAETRPSVPEKEVKMKDGKEIRSEDIRKATSSSLRDRSAKLPQPTMVSDSPGRPIVSFQKDWRPNEVELKQEMSPIKPAISTSAVVASKESPRPNGESEKPQSVVRKQVPRSSGGSSMQVPNRERERVSPPPAPLVHGATELIVPTLDHGSMSIPSIAVNSAPPVPVIAINNAPQPIPTVAVNDKPRPIPTIAVDEMTPPGPRSSVGSLPSSLRIGFSDHRSVPTIAVNDNRPLPAIAVNGSRSGSSIQNSNNRPLPTIAVNERPSVHDPVPSIAVSAPMIAISGPPANGSSTRPLPTPTKGRPGPRHAASAPPGSANLRNSHITPTGYAHPRGTGALCSMCALPIAGRIVTAAGVRFHPECFRCHHCGEGLECVAFYPEPESARLDRVNRIRDRMAGYDDVPGCPEEDGDECLRFYCHLDYHEFFSPRCKSCKTPIEGEVVVACGAEWHVGHFFCAQCGDVSLVPLLILSSRMMEC
jgi:hypothetical protein